MEGTKQKNLPKKVIGDFVLSIFASSLSVFTAQLVVYPILGNRIGETEFGKLLTLMGVVNAISAAFGNTLNNTRLLLQRNYEQKGIQGDFNILFLIVAFLVATSTFFIALLLFSLPIVDSIWLVVIAVLICARSYYAVSFRIVINYFEIFILSLVLSVGYLLGLYISKVVNSWQFCFLTGETFAFVYLLFRAPLFKEGLKKTKLWVESRNKYIVLLAATLLSSSLVYMDRFLIYPMLGAADVPVYNAASLLGKSLGIVTIPLTGVILSYYSKMEKMGLKTFLLQLLIAGAISILAFIMILLFGPWFLSIIYPLYYREAQKILAVSSLSSISFILGSVIQPTTLRFAKSYWQTIIQASYFAIYVIIAIALMKANGLYGFSIGTLLANIYRLLFILFLSIISLKKGEKQHESLY